MRGGKPLPLLAISRPIHMGLIHRVIPSDGGKLRSGTEIPDFVGMTQRFDCPIGD